MSPRLLVVTNDFPPRPGGIQSFVHGVVSRLPPDDVVVLTSTWRGCERWDAEQEFRVVRHDTSVLLPTPGVRRRATALLQEHGCTAVWFGAAAPLGLLAPSLRAAGATRLVATTHGHEIGWAAIPGARTLLRRIAADVDVLTYLGDYTRRRLAAGIAPHDDRLRRLVPGVDSELFTPAARDEALRERLGLVGRPVVVCVSRLMPRKGQDMLLRALPEIRRRVPGAALVLVGGGPSRRRLERLAAELGVSADVAFAGSVDHPSLPAWYAVGDVFAMPCRERLHGLDVEGLGMVFLEAAACGLPVVAGGLGRLGRRGAGRRDRRRRRRRRRGQDRRAVSGLLADPSHARVTGARGRDWVADAWTWERTVDAFTSYLQPGV